MKEADAGKREVFFVDAIHFVYGAFLCYVWCLVRQFVSTGSGRQRLNVLGAIGYASKKFVSEVTVGSVSAENVCDLLKKVRRRTTKPITVVLDNVRYQKTDEVRALAASLGIELLYLPPYSPNLNLIERVWKFVKSRAVAGRVLPSFDAFQDSILSIIHGLETTYRKEVASLMTPDFQTFENVQIPAD